MAIIKKLKKKNADGTFDDVNIGADAVNIFVEVDNGDGTTSTQDLQSIMTEIQGGLVRWNEGLE